MKIRTWIKSIVIILSSSALFQLGVLNERYFPEARNWPLEGEGIFWILLVTLILIVTLCTGSLATESEDA